MGWADSQPATVEPGLVLRKMVDHASSACLRQSAVGELYYPRHLFNALGNSAADRQVEVFIDKRPGMGPGSPSTGTV